MVGPAAFAGFLAGGAALTALDYSPSIALAYGARKFYKAEWDLPEPGGPYSR